jgi:hypothetical protein
MQELPAIAHGMSVWTELGSSKVMCAGLEVNQEVRVIAQVGRKHFIRDLSYL